MAKKKLTLEDMLIPKEQIPYEVPENWCWVKLKDISLIISKGTTPKGGKSAYLDNGVKFLRVENINDYGYIDSENIKYVSEDTHLGFLKRSILFENDILISIAGTLGKTAIVRKGDLPLNTNQAIAFIRLKNTEKILPKYVKLFLSSPEVSKELLSQAKVTAIPNLTLEIIGNCKIPIPPLVEQERIIKKIESLFEKVDKAAGLVDEARDGFEKRRAAILEKAFCGELTAKWREENGVSNENKTKKLSNLCDIIMGQSPKGSSYNDIGEGVPLVNGPVEFGPSHFSKTIKSKWTTQPTKMCKELDLLLCVRGSTLGRINIAGFEACVGRGVAAIRAKSGVDQTYINYKIHAMRNEIYNIGTGTTFPNISAQQIKDIEIFIPSIEEQREIVSILELVLGNEADIEKITNINKNIDIIKKSILAKAFRGELGSNNLDDNNSIRLLK